ncbi:hypothetical protein U1Q18_016142 [Sarracenia purpurea var. burkii]
MRNEKALITAAAEDKQHHTFQNVVNSMGCKDRPDAGDIYLYGKKMQVRRYKCNYNLRPAEFNCCCYFGDLLLEMRQQSIRFCHFWKLSIGSVFCFGHAKLWFAVQDGLRC